MLSTISHDETIMPRWSTGEMRDAFTKHSKKRRFIRAFYQEGMIHLNADNHSSGSFADTAYCNCLVDIEAGNMGIEKGAQVSIVLFE